VTGTELALSSVKDKASVLTINKNGTTIIWLRRLLVNRAPATISEEMSVM
jgi:hypothetical protein